MAALRLTPRAVAIDEEGMRPESLAAALRAGVSAVLINSRGQNPTGAALTPARAAELLAVLKDHPEVIVLEDDHMADIVGVGSVSVAADPATRRWAVVRSVSKSLGPDLRLAVLTGDATTVARVEARQVVGTGWVGTLLQRLVAALWKSPEVTALGGTGFNVWIPLEREGAVTERLLAGGWAVGPGDTFRLESGPGIRVTTARLEPEDATAFIRELAAALSAPSGRADY